MTKLRWFQLFNTSQNLNLFEKNLFFFWFPWCSTREYLSIDVSITNVGLIPGNKEKNDVGYQCRLTVHFVKVVPTLHLYVGLTSEFKVILTSWCKADVVTTTSNVSTTMDDVDLKQHLHSTDVGTTSQVFKIFYSCQFMIFPWKYRG